MITPLQSHHRTLCRHRTYQRTAYFVPLHAVFLAAVLLVSTGCGRGPSADTTSTDASSNETSHVDTDPTTSKATNATRATTAPELRLVVLSPALAVTLVDLGLEDAIVGRHGYDMVLRESVPVCGDQGGIDYERLLSVDPTHVLLEWGARELPERLRTLAGQRGWEISNHRLLTLDHVATTADDLYERFVRRGPTESMPPELSGFLPNSASASNPIPGAVRTESDVPRPGRRMAAAWGARDDRELFTGTVLLLGSIDPISALGPGSAHHELLVRMGATPALTEGAPWITLDAEDLIALDPGAIVLIAPRPRSATPGSSSAPPELRQTVDALALNAARHGHLALIDHPHALLPSTALIDVADDLRDILEGWAR